MEQYPQLKLENQLCFPLYAAAKEIVRRYSPYLDPLGITYTQYLVMMVLWEEREITVNELGHRLYLDSGTLTPVLKKLETKGYLDRTRCHDDERCVMISLTAEGEALAGRASGIPAALGSCIPLSLEEAQSLYGLLYKVLNIMK